MKTAIDINEMFQVIFQVSASGILVLDRQGLIILANPAAKLLFGDLSTDLIDVNIDIWIPNFTAQIQLTANHEQNTEVEGKFYANNKDGSKFTFNYTATCSALRNELVTIVSFSNVAQITNGINKEEQTIAGPSDKDAKFDKLLNNFNGIAFYCKNSLNYDLDFISQGCFTITGYTAEELTSDFLTFGNIIFEEDRAIVWEKIQEAVKHNQEYDFEYRILHKDGSVRHVHEKGVAVCKDDNTIEILKGYIYDITLLKESETRLHRSEKKIKALLKAIPDTILLQDLNGNYLELYSNNTSNFVMPAKVIVGSNMKDALPPAVYYKLKKIHERVIESGLLQITEYCFSESDKIYHHEARVVLKDEETLLTIIRDITDIKVADELLTIRNNALASTINSIVISDAQLPNFPIVYCNQAFEKLTGFSSEEIIGRNYQFLQHDDRDQKEIECMHKSVMDGKPCNVVLRNYKKNGTLFWNDVTITPIYNAEQILTHFIAIQIDITKKVSAEDLQEQVKKTLELIAKDRPLEEVGNTIVSTIETHIENSMVSILLWDKRINSFQKLVAPNVPKPFSKCVDQLFSNLNLDNAALSSNFTEIVIVADISKSKFWNNYKEIASMSSISACWSFPIKSSSSEVLGIINVFNEQTRPPLPSELETISAIIDLISIPVEKESTAAKLRDSKIQLEKYALKLEDLVQERTQEVMATMQKLVETNFNLENQILKAKKAQYFAKTSKSIASEIAKNFPKGFVAVIDTDLKIVFAEGEYIEQLGLEKLYVEGMYLDDFSTLSKTEIELIKEDVLKTLKGERLSFEIKFKDKYFAVKTVPLIDDNNLINNTLLVYNDISLQKEVEFSIQKALEKERELNILKSRFISMASHEFRTPLSAILTSAILIGKQNEIGDKIKISKYVIQIEKNINNLTAILNDFLSISKLEEGKLVAKPTKFDLILFSKDYLKESFIGLEKEQKIWFNSTADQLDVELDIRLLNHILDNLLSNASKYSEIGSIINFKISQVNNSIIIEISDSGMGIPQDDQKHMFSRFFRAANVQNIPGTGLGLNIVKYYAELMGGSIKFKSKVLSGTTIWITFPEKINNN